ncbi:hypothetical protein Ahy_A03g011818 isoform A [Arachis hypogaea]|uniref:Dynamin-related protein 3A n=1 Tax=Arachis hypogaea TaxID=3818 RepID=A0A445DRT5_ARAHY|nr:hypothetical protein Ahy_A03g011818 isoform A [Arachis hypogaea]
MAEDHHGVPFSPPSSSSSSSPAPLGSSVISLVNRLQDIFSRVGIQNTIELPQVAVVGSQSSGKSSVLEALVGRDFLPRGNDICTRRPLVLQLVQTKRHPDGTEEEFGEFLHLPGRRFHDFSQIRREIQAETDKEAGDNKGVSDKQIRLKIFSPNVLDITLVDLPGITKVPVGDQPSDIEARIRTMIMGTDARNLLLGKVVPLRLGYVGVVNRCQEDILLNRSIKDALVAEEKFFRSRPVYSGLADSCGIPQLAKKLNQILAQHIKTVLPGLRARISTSLAGQGALLLNILSKYCDAFSSMVDGKNEEMSTSELSGGARIHYIFQSIFVNSLEEVDPCEDLSDDDIRTAIHNATGPRSALFVPEVPFEVLIKRQISRLLDPGIQCARFIYDELMKISHRCMVTELQRFPFLRKRIDEVIGNFLREGLAPSETMIAHLIEMEVRQDMDYINTSHPNFIGGSKALELAAQQMKNSRVSLSVAQVKDALDSDKGPASERNGKSRGMLPLPRQPNGVVIDPKPSFLFWNIFDKTQGNRVHSDVEKVIPSGNASGGGLGWRLPFVFGDGDNRPVVKENTASKQHIEPVHGMELSFSIIQLREPPPVLRPSESSSETEAMEITVTKLLLTSYYDIVRKNVEDLVPKAIMHFLVNNTKRELHNVFIQKLYREDLFEEMLQEPEEIAKKRKRCQELLRAFQQAFRDLDELPLEAETVERGYSLAESAGMPKIHGLPTSSMYSSGDYYSASPNNQKFKKSSHSGELRSSLDSNGSWGAYM